MSRPLTCAALVLAAAACARLPAAGGVVAGRSLLGTDGATHALAPSAGAAFAVVVFFANHCPCQAAHDPRVRELYAAYHARGVDFFAVDSETDATKERDALEAAKRGYSFPILMDPGGAFAKSIGAEYATETLVLDRTGTVRYRGGIDSDRKTLHADATPFLREALEDLVSGRAVRRPESKALGCALEMW